MANEVLTFTPIWFCFETEERRRQRSMKESAAAHKVKDCISHSGIYNMERLNSMTQEEILAIPGIKKNDYHYVEEALEDFRKEFGNLKWKMPEFTDIEHGYLLHVMVYRKPPHYYELLKIFSDLENEKNKHPLHSIMSQIYYKLRSIERDEFAAIMAAKDVRIEDYKI